MARRQQFVFCPSCGDPVPGPFPRTGEFVECSYCKDTFPFDAQSARTALIEYHEPERRWAIVPIHSEMDAQVERLLLFCSQAVPGCTVHITPVGPDSFRMKVKDEETVLIEYDLAFYTHELVQKSDEELWKLLEDVSQQRIRQRH